MMLSHDSREGRAGRVSWWETWPGTAALRGAGLAQREEFLSPLYGYILNAVHKLV